MGEGHVRSPSLAGDRIVFGLDTLESPVDLYSVSAKGGAIERLTEVNADRLAGVELGKAEQFTFEGWNDETVHALRGRSRPTSTRRRSIRWRS